MLCTSKLLNRCLSCTTLPSLFRIIQRAVVMAIMTTSDNNSILFLFVCISEASVFSLAPVHPYYTKRNQHHNGKNQVNELPPELILNQRLIQRTDLHLFV